MVPPLIAVWNLHPVLRPLCRLLWVRCQHFWRPGLKVELCCKLELLWPSPPTSFLRHRAACPLPASRRVVEPLTPPLHKVQEQNYESTANLIFIFLTSVSCYRIKGVLCNTFPCLSAGLKAFRQQLRKNTRTKGLLGLNKIKGLTRQVVPPPSCNRGSRGSLGPALCEHRSMLEEVLHQQRWDTLLHERTLLLLKSTY